MGQAFRRAAGKPRNTGVDTTSSSAPSRYQNSFDRRPPEVPHDRIKVYKNDADGVYKSNAEVSPERDPKFEAMLNQMVGRITTKPGGKLETGEAFVVQKPNRPLPKVRNTTPGSGHYEERPVAAGTLNVAQLRHIMHLHQGKADDHDGPMSPKEIAEMFRVDAVLLERIFQFVSLPLEDDSSKTRFEM